MSQHISTYLSNNKANSQQDESVSDFLQRRCHRDKINSCYWKILLEELIMLTRTRKIKYNHYLYLLEQKWGPQFANEFSKDMKQWRSTLIRKKDEIDSNERIVLEQINKTIAEESKFDTTIWKRQLGHFHTVCVDVNSKNVSCDCELYNFAGVCMHFSP